MYSSIHLGRAGVYPSMYLGRGCASQHAPEQDGVDRGCGHGMSGHGGVDRGCVDRGCLHGMSG